jgi:AP endonuclease-1
VVTEEKVTVETKVASRSKKAVAVKTEVEVEVEINKKVPVSKTAKRKSNGAAKVKTEEDEDSPLSDLSDSEEDAPKPVTKKRKTKTKPKAEPSGDGEAAKGDDDSKPKKKRRTKAEKEAEEAMVLAARTAATALKRAMFIGAHVSAAGGVHNSIQNATKIGANAFALFLKSQRKWESPPLQDEHRDEFHARLKSHDYDAAKHVLPHGSYLINLAQPDKAKADQGYESFIDDLRRCEALGIRLYNFHPGSTGGDTMEAACGRIAAQLNRAIRETKTVVPLLECMCGSGSGNVIGSRFEDLREIIAGIEDKSRIGVCLDTCHAFAAGYDLRTPEAFEATMRKFDEIVGIKYLKALHCMFPPYSVCPLLTKLTNKTSKRQQSTIRISPGPARQYRHRLPGSPSISQRHELRAVPASAHGARDAHRSQGPGREDDRG